MTGSNTVDASKLPFSGRNIKKVTEQTVKPIVIPVVEDKKDKKTIKETAVVFDGVKRTNDSIIAMTQAIREKESRGDTYNINLNTLQPTAETGKAIVESIKEFTNRGGNFFRATQVAL